MYHIHKILSYSGLLADLAFFDFSLAVRDLSNLVKPEDVIATEHLVTLLAIVPKYSQKDWLASYETLTDYVVIIGFYAYILVGWWFRTLTWWPNDLGSLWLIGWSIKPLDLWSSWSLVVLLFVCCCLTSVLLIKLSTFRSPGLPRSCTRIMNMLFIRWYCFIVLQTILEQVHVKEGFRWACCTSCMCLLICGCYSSKSLSSFKICILACLCELSV